MNDEFDVIWRKGDGEMPDKAKRVVNAAREEKLLRSLQLPIEVVDTVRYNASKNDQTVNDYISSIVVGYIKPA